MADLAEAKKKAIDFLFKSIEEQSPECWFADIDPLIFEASSYLAHKGKISKSEWGRKIDESWDLWEVCFDKKKGVFWPAKEEDWWNYSTNHEKYMYDLRFDIEYHIAMFRAKETFDIPGYEDAFFNAKTRLIKNLEFDLLLFPDECNRILWQIVRSPFLRTVLKDYLKPIAGKILNQYEKFEKDILLLGSGHRERPERNGTTITSYPSVIEIFFLLIINLEDYQIDIAEKYLKQSIGAQRTNGSFHEDPILTCLYLISVRLCQIDPDGIISNKAISWLLDKQNRNGSWQYLGADDVIKTDKIKGEDVFLTVLVMETLDLITNDKPLPRWVENVTFKQSLLKEIHIFSSSLAIPEGIKWENVSITFISNESVEIRAGLPLGVMNFIELGFKDRRTDKPDYKWEILKVLARNSGLISWKEKSASSKWKPHIKILRKRLRALFKIDDDPFFPYRRSAGYQTKFSIAFREEN